MATATVRITIEISGSVYGATRVEPAEQNFYDALGQISYYDLPIGETEIERPLSPVAATGVLIVPPGSGTHTYGLSFETGTPTLFPHSVSPTWIAFNAGAAPDSLFFTVDSVLFPFDPLVGMMLVWI